MGVAARLVAAIVVVLAASTTPAPAHAARPVAAGARYEFIPPHGGWDTCLIGVVRADRTAVSAGHCGQPGTPVSDVDGTPIGVVTETHNPVAPGDYSIIRLDDHAAAVVTPGMVAAPHVGEIACAATMCGIVTRVTAREFGAWLPAYPGESGGLAADGARLLGIVSRIDADPMAPWVFTRLDWIREIRDHSG